MEEEKAAAYYDELSRKGEGAARFKQGLGFSSSSAPDLKRPPPTATSFLSNFVRASSPGKAAEIHKEAQLERIQNKLKKKPPPPPSQPLGSGGDGDADWRRRRRSRSRSRSRSRERYRDRRRSPSGEGGRSPRRHHSHGRRRRGDDDEERCGSSSRRRSRSRSGSEERESSRQSRRGDKREREDRSSYSSSRRGRRSRSPPSSPRSRGADWGRRDLNGDDGRKREEDGSWRPDNSRGRKSATDYSQLINGYSQMTPAERVKAKMKFQLSQTAAKDMVKGVTTGWERFDFDKDAPLDDEEIEVAEDDEALVKDIGQSFRYSAVEAKREEEIKAAHDQAMFGASTSSPILPGEEVTEETDEKDEKSHVNNTLINERALAIQGSWRDRIRKPQDGQ